MLSPMENFKNCRVESWSSALNGTFKIKFHLKQSLLLVEIGKSDDIDGNIFSIILSIFFLFGGGGLCSGPHAC
jgi:hypothetical protein